MKKRIRKAGRKLKSGKFASALRALTTPHHSETRILQARTRVAEHLKALSGNTVLYGPFKGMALPDRSSWGVQDVSSKILGTYEGQISDALTRLSRTDGLLVDLGSADGYFAVGALRAGLFGRCIGFERSAKGQAALRDAAARNGAEDRLEIFGEATETALMDAVSDPDQTVILCDIEGGEFELLNDRVLAHFAKAHFLIELHDILAADGPSRKDALLDRAARHFDCTVLRATLPDIHSFRELDGFDDDHRLLAFSEGRDAAMEWLHLQPRALS
jgi:hypothetical protein